MSHSQERVLQITKKKKEKEDNKINSNVSFFAITEISGKNSFAGMVTDQIYSTDPLTGSEVGSGVAQ